MVEEIDEKDIGGKREFVNLELIDDEIFNTKTDFFFMQECFKDKSKRYSLRRIIDIAATEIRKTRTTQG